MTTKNYPIHQALVKTLHDKKNTSQDTAWQWSQIYAMKMQNEHVLNKILIFDNLVIGKHEMALNRKEL